jgi:hypothetical protein
MQDKNTTILAMIGAVVILGGIGMVTVAQESRVSEYSVSIDADQDGLSNDEERLYGTDPNIRDTDGDGYSDGVEIKSGYDPLIPAPGDRLGVVAQAQIAQISGSEVNLTNQFATVVAGMTEEAFASGKDELSVDDIQGEATAIMGDSISFDDLKEVDVSKIRIKKQDYSDLSKKERKARVKKDIDDYVTAMTYIMSIYSPVPVDMKSPESIQKFTAQIMLQMTQFSQDFSNSSFFTKIAKNGEKMLSEFNDIAVPEVMVPTHVKGLQLAQFASEIGTDFKVKEEDPMAMIAEMSRMQALVMMASEFYDELSAELEKYE